MESAQLVSTILKAKKSLGSIGSSPFGSEENSVNGEETDGLITGVKNSWIHLLAGGAVVSGVASMAFTSAALVDIASISCMCLAPYAVYQKHQLKLLGGMRGQQNQLRQSVNSFHEENKKLEKNVTNLRTNVDELKEVEKDLDAIVKKSGGNADRLVNIIKENGELQQKIKSNLEKNILQSILTAVLISDLNEDFSLNKRELKRLENRLGSLPAVTFDKNNWRKLIDGQDEVDLAHIMGVIRNLEEDIPEEDNIFHLHPEKIK